MHSGISPTHLDQPLTADEAAELARLHQKVARSNYLSRLGDRLTGFYRRHYLRWLALNPLLPRRYFGDWSIPVARWPWSARPYPVSPPYLALTLRESDTLECLDARRRRPAELAQLDYAPQAPNGWINRYERRKSKTLPEQQAEQAQAVLDDFDARLPERRAHLKQHYVDDYLAYQRSVIGFDKMVDDFRRHMTAELALLTPGATLTHSLTLGASATDHIEFADYLKDEYRTMLLPFLKSKYTNSKSKILASLLFALTDLELMTASLSENQTELHQSLVSFFGSIGTRQALNINITKLNSASQREHQTIEKIRKLIQQHLATSST
ncbi:MAG: hypothetical protein ACRYFX_13085 [Janthinobacterium lividum]